MSFVGTNLCSTKSLKKYIYKCGIEHWLSTKWHPHLWTTFIHNSKSL